MGQPTELFCFCNVKRFLNVCLHFTWLMSLRTHHFLMTAAAHMQPSDRDEGEIKMAHSSGTQGRKEMFNSCLIGQYVMSFQRFTSLVETECHGLNRQQSSEIIEASLFSVFFIGFAFYCHTLSFYPCPSKKYSSHSGLTNEPMKWFSTFVTSSMCSFIVPYSISPVFEWVL